MVMTLKPKNSPHTGRVLLCLAPRKHDTCANEWQQCCFFFSVIKALCTMNLLLKVRQLIKIFIWWFWDVCGMWYEESGLICGLWEAGSFIMIEHLLTQHCYLDNSWQNIQSLLFHNPPIHLTTPSSWLFCIP
jgi:hypothetical protein